MLKASLHNEGEKKIKVIQLKTLAERFQTIFMFRIRKCFDRLYWADRIEEYMPLSKETEMYSKAVAKQLSHKLRDFYKKKAEKKIKQKLEILHTQGSTLEGMKLTSKYTRKELNPQLCEEKLFYQQSINKMSQCKKQIAMLRERERQKRELKKKLAK